MNFARSNVSEALDLDALASVACLSKYHFSRVFEAYFRETPSRFIARARLELSARRLVYMRDKSITQIALDCGFSGSDTFSRSFRKRFGSPPRSFRDSNRWGFGTIERSHPLGLELHRPGVQISPEDATGMQVRIERRPEYRVAYIRHVGPYGDVDDSITGAFAALQRWAGLRGFITPQTSYLGVCPDNCSTTPARYCVYDACISLLQEIPEDDVVSIQTIPAATFAVLRVTCPPAQLNRMWAWLYSTWLPASGKSLAYKPNYEFFREFGFTPIRSDFGAELCVPIMG